MKFKMRKQEYETNFEKLWNLLGVQNRQTHIQEKEISLSFEANIGNRRIQVKCPTFANVRPTYLFEDKEGDAAQFLYYTVFENEEMKRMFTDEKFVRSLSTEFREKIDHLLLEQAKEQIGEKISISKVGMQKSDEDTDMLVFSMGEKGLYERRFNYIPRDNGGYLSFYQETREKIDWLDFFEAERNGLFDLNFPVSMKSNKRLFLNQVIHELVLEEYCKTEEYRLKNLFHQ